MKCVKKGSLYNIFKVEETEAFYEKIKILNIDAKFEEDSVKFYKDNKMSVIKYGDYITVDSDGKIRGCTKSKFIEDYTVIDEYDYDTKDMRGKLSTIINQNNKLITLLDEFSEKGNRIGVNELLETVKIQFSKNMKLLEERTEEKESQKPKFNTDSFKSDTEKEFAVLQNFSDALAQSLEGLMNSLTNTANKYSKK